MKKERGGGEKAELEIFFVGGVQSQVRQVFKDVTARCVRCGADAALVEYEDVLKLFFVPVWRWPGKSPALYCENCSLLSPYRYSSFTPPPDGRRSGSPMLQSFASAPSPELLSEHVESEITPFCTN